MHLAYDGSHQLTQVRRTTQDQDGTITVATTRYRYDAFGRRIAKMHQPSQEAQTETTYFGWDGDRMAHTETATEVDNTVYELNTFIPMIKLSRKKGSPRLIDVLLGEASALMPQQARGAIEKGLAMTLNMPKQKRMGLMALPGIDVETVEASLQGLVEQKRAAELEHPVSVLYYHCDHLGTPIAMTELRKVCIILFLDAMARVSH